MSHFALCRNDPFVEMVRHQLGCNPVLKPSTKNRPLDLLIVKGGKTENLGYIQGFLQTQFVFPSTTYDRATLTDISGKASAQVGLDPGLGLIHHFIGTDFNNDLRKMYFSGKEQMTFHFNHVEVLGVPLGLLRDQLRESKVDITDEMFSSKNWMGQPDYQFFIISKVITCKNWGVVISGAAGPNLSSAFRSTPADSRLSVTALNDQTLMLEYKADQPLTFAFACHRIYIGEDGTLKPLIETAKVPPLSFSGSAAANGGPVLLTDEPVLMEIDHIGP